MPNLTEKELRKTICDLLEQNHFTIEKAMSVLSDVKTDILSTSVCKAPEKIINLPYQIEP
ncbi:MAG: hypothetical protein ACYDEJ_03485 [Desulfitobacteriaceae bacterium]